MSAKEILGPVAKVVAAGLGLGFLGVMGVTARHHRELTHRSLTLNPALGDLIDAEMRVYSPDSSTWAAVHRIHHHIPDATLSPFLRISRAINWAEENPERTQDVKIPDAYQYLDPFVDRFSKEDVLAIGHFAEKIMKERLGDTYQIPKNYNPRELETILNPAEPMYFYPRNLRLDGEFSQDEIEGILLGDPHSPVRIPPPEKNGVRGVFSRNVNLYRHASHLFRDRPELKPEDLQTGKKVDHREVRIRGFVEGSLIAVGLVLLGRNKYEPKDFLKAVPAGIAINIVKLGLHIFGGNVTNSLGHAGVMTPERFRTAIGSSEYKPTLNPDGTISTDSVNGGLIGRFISTLTLDEVGGQQAHHLGPDKIPYTPSRGLKAWSEAPWGMLLSVLARSRYFPLINEGQGFDLKMGETRPDEPNPSLEIIHRRRVEQLAAR